MERRSIASRLGALALAPFALLAHGMGMARDVRSSPAELAAGIRGIPGNPPGGCPYVPARVLYVKGHRSPRSQKKLRKAARQRRSGGFSRW